MPAEAPPGPEPGPSAEAALAHRDASAGLPAEVGRAVDVMVVMLHGPYGEDGTIQGLLELADIPYTGAGVLASAVGMDKVTMKTVFRAHGLPIVDHVVVERREWRSDPATVIRRIVDALGFPCFVKPANLGSSVGITKASNHNRRLRSTQTTEVPSERRAFRLSNPLA